MSRLSYDPTHCTLCPRRCGGDRTRAKGYCRMPDRPVVARAALPDRVSREDAVYNLSRAALTRRNPFMSQL